MKTETIVRCVGLLLMVSVLPGFAESQLGSHGPHAEGELLVRWEDGPESYAAAIGNSSIGAEVKRNFTAIGWQHVKLPDGMSLTEAIAKYRALGTVLAVEPNYAAWPILPPKNGRDAVQDAVPSLSEIGHGEDAAPPTVRSPLARLSLALESSPTAASASAGVVPNDPRFNSQWSLKKIGMPEAWMVTTGSSNIIVGVIDSGLDYTHEDLRGNMWHNPGETGFDANGNDKATNGIDDDGDGYVDDVYGINALNHTGDPMDAGYARDADQVTPSYHGTKCAGIIGAVGNNGKGVAGICWAVNLMGLRAWSGNLNTTSWREYIDAALESYNYIIAMRRRGVNVRVTNNSNGFWSYSQALKDAIDIAGETGILSVWIAHNQGYDVDRFPVLAAAYDSPYIISVAATDKSDNLQLDSNFGKSTIDLAAPSEVPTTDAFSSNYEADFVGTSSAGPHVAGTAALLWAVKPDASPLEIKAALMQSVDRLPTLVGKVAANGRLNVARALQVLTNDNLPPVILGAFPGSAHSFSNAPIEVYFSKPMNRTSVETAFEALPIITGSFEWSEGDRILRINHSGPFARTNYTLRIHATAADLTGALLDGDFDRVGSGTATDDFVWTFRFPVTNDEFADAQIITGSSGSVSGTTQYATPDYADSLASSLVFNAAQFSVWYRWVADATGWMTFDLSQGNKFDTVLGLFTGSQLEQLSAIGVNDNYGSKSGSRLSFAATQGTVYSIEVAAKFPDTFSDSQWGNFVLNWYATPLPGFTGSEFSPMTGLEGTKVTLTGTNFTGANWVAFGGVLAVFTNASNNNLDLKIIVTVPPGAGSGPITVSAPGGTAVTSRAFQIPIPSLAIQALEGGMVKIQWQEPSTTLEVSESVGNAANWTEAGGNIDVTLAGYSLVLSASNGPKFYRLRKN